MPLIILLILILLVAQIGFWDTFEAILGGVLMLVLLFLLLILVGILVARWAWGRVGRRPPSV